MRPDSSLAPAPRRRVPGRPSLPRRTLLRAGGLALGLPFLDAMSTSTRLASAAPRKRRLLVMFSGNGTIHSSWTPKRGPSGAETDFALSPILEPLAPHRERVVVIGGVDQQGDGSDGHLNGIAGLLTGQPVVLESTVNPNTGRRVGWAGGISIDQYVAHRLAADTPLRSLELGVQPSASHYGHISYAGPNRPIPSERDPAAVFARLFGDPTRPPEEVARRRAERGTALDAIRQQLSSLRAEVGHADRERLDAHLGSIREIEGRLSRLPVPPGRCAVPPRPPELAVMENDNFPRVGELQKSLLLAAIACDITRVATLCWGGAAGGPPRFTWLGIEAEHHSLSHEGDSNKDATEKLVRINHWYAAHFAALIAGLAATREGDGTALDGTVLFWGNELGKGNAHSRTDAPYVLAGGAASGLRTGRFLSFEGKVPHNNLLLSMLHALDLPATSFGKAAWCTGPLPGLT